MPGDGPARRAAQSRGGSARVRKGYHHGGLRRALIEAAVKAIARRGIDALNLRELAARAGVTPGRPIITSPTGKRSCGASPRKVSACWK